MQIEGHVFVVTGGGNGIGRQVVLQLLRRGASVAAVDLRVDGLAETARIAAAGSRLTTHQADVTDHAAVVELAAEVVRRHGAVDGIVNIAGIIHRFAHFHELSDAEGDRVLRINVDGVVTMCRVFLPALLTRPRASITNMASLAGLVPFASQTLYGASKGAVKQFSEGLYAELQGTAVEVHTVFPGEVRTELTANSGVEMLDAGDKARKATTPEQAGAVIVDGIRRGRFRILVGSDARILDALMRIAPGWTVRFVARQMASVM